jgi:carboxyl-terminal processing protease
MHADTRRWPPILAMALLCVRAAAAEPELEAEMARFVDVFAALEAQGADPLDADTAIYRGAIPSMLRTLDPHSAFFDPEQFSQLQSLQVSERKGFGTIVSILPGRVIVLQTLDGTPAARAGLSGGDEILAVNDYQVAYLDVEQIRQLLGAARQQPVTLEVRHPGAERTVRMTMSPQTLAEPTVDRALLLEPGVAYLRIRSFEEPTGRLVQQKIEELGGEFLKGLILDLRDNPGGVVSAALDTASLFLSPGQLVFSSRGRSAETQEVYVSQEAEQYTFPMAVLMNGNSASAAEIVAGALQDHDRAYILGEVSYGKGLVQQVFPLMGSTAVALTTAFYYTPSGRSIQKPLAGTQLDTDTRVSQGLFMSDAGRALKGGGGIQPDETVPPAALSRLQLIIDASGALTSFAGEYLRGHELPLPFEITPQIMADARLYLAARHIEPDTADWNNHRDWIESRLRQEFLNLTIGVAKGDELELRRDPVVQAALRKLRAAP